MQKPNVVLDILSKRSKDGKDIDQIYRCMYNPEWYLLAYNRLAKTVNSHDVDIVDGMSLKRITCIVDEMKFERYKWKDSKVITTYKSGFKQLLLPDWRDKLVQEVMYMLLYAIYEPKFSDASHGYRHGRGVHTALTRIRQKGNATEYFIKGDISRCYEMIDHKILLNILSKTIKDGRFIELVRKMLRAGRFGDDLTYGKSYSGIPIGGKLSSLLLNIYLNELDSYIDRTVCIEFNQLSKRPINKVYGQIRSKIEYRLQQLRVITDIDKIKKFTSEIKTLRKELRNTPSKCSIKDTTYRRLIYTRYADDWIICFVGTYKEAQSISNRIQYFLKDQLKLKIEQDRCQINKANKVPTRFLGYDIITQWDDTKIGPNNQRSLSGSIGFLIPKEVIIRKRSTYMKHNKPIHLSQCIHDSVFDIIQSYQWTFSNFCQYYKFARNQHLLNVLKWVMRTSLAKTLAAKLKISVTKVFKRFSGTRTVNGFTYKVLMTSITSATGSTYIAYFGAVPLRRQIALNTAVIKDINDIFYQTRTALSDRLMRNVCEICGSTNDIQIHHIHHMKDVQNDKSIFSKKMIAMNRKTLAVCKDCHWKIHNGSYDDRKLR